MRIMTILRAALAAAVLAGWGAFSPPAPAAEPAQKPAQQPAAQEDDEWQGLPEGPGREEVFYVCQACHSLAIVKQQGLDRASWDEVLKWMVAEQEMEPLEAEPRKLVLDYLSKHYGRE
jgi:cytochrome c5